MKIHRESIIEVTVYDGALKVWRILNLNTGSIYSMRYETEEIARDSIEEGDIRGGKIVVGCTFRDLALFRDSTISS
jgi:hypothetical protein